MGASFSKMLREWYSRTSVMDKIKLAGKVYLVAALLHVMYKIRLLVSFMRKAKRYLRAVKGRAGDLSAQELFKNFHRFHDWRRDFLLKYPNEDLVRTPGPGPVELAFVSEDAVRSDHQTDYLFKLLNEFIGNEGIFLLPHGDQPEFEESNSMWYSQRKTASKIFTKNNFMNVMGETFLEKSDRLIQVIERAAKNQDKVDGQRLFFSFTMDSIQKIFFARDVDTADGEVDPYANAYDKAHNSMMTFIFKYVGPIMISVLLLPFPFGSLHRKDQQYNLTICLIRALASEMKTFDKSVAYLNEQTDRIVKEAREDPKLGTRQDLLAKFLNSKYGSELTDKQYRDLLLNFIIAGRDTTACTLTWLFYELTQNPEVQEKLIQEVDSVLQGRNPTMDDLSPSKMPYLTGVLYETLRLHPPVPEDLKICSEDVSFKGVRIPKDTRCIFLPYSMGRNPDKFPKPLEFQPERWIPFVEPSPYAFPVFQSGPRMCLGKDMAIFEAKTLTAKLLQKFTFSLLPGEAEKISYSLMITMSLTNDGPKKESNNLWLCPTIRPKQN
eukprot:CAMPEP_0203783606 /NCGR_PEP_ID=MMETSP0100_2-20121128/12_1 /ASSEMBLY_ACC=CAM_ASM_000210 /TAXON_ID=96639 /ORGANISM=" , Strain NY0313808BC1" /LENGTH=550 /DNA_ID=CAMNT_0050685511 /DNA_START=95 /DNA_END=1747 /DNA_ORIENTATION=-